MANQEQVDRLTRNIEEWNQWRDDNPGWDVEIDLEEVILSGADLRKANLYCAYFCYADLCFVNFEGADLTSANFEGANLSNAYFEGVNLSHANLNSTDLFGANLRGANLSNTNFWRAYLPAVYLEGANLSNASLSHANLEGADLEGANLEGADLSYAYLEGANLRGANLSNAKIKCTLLSASLEKAILTGACIQDWRVNSETNFDDVICDYIYLKSEYENGEYVYKNRCPSDPNKNFKPGDFARLVKSSLEAVDLIFSNGIDSPNWK